MPTEPGAPGAHYDYLSRVFDHVDQHIRAARWRGLLTVDQDQRVRSHLRTIDARETCPICDAGRWSAELRGDWIARVCASCGHVLLFDPIALLGLQPGWRVQDGRWSWVLVPVDAHPY